MKIVLPKIKEPKKRKRGAGGQVEASAGDITFIRVPMPPATAFNKDRPIGCLIQAQLRHIQHAESARLPKEKRDGRGINDIHTEAEAASYFASVTKVLHPEGRKKSRSRAAKL